MKTLKQFIKENREPRDRTVAIILNNRKPPHLGHYNALLHALVENDEVHVIISPETQDKITADDTLKIWEQFGRKHTTRLHPVIANEDHDRITGEKILKGTFAQAKRILNRLNEETKYDNISVKVYTDSDRRYRKLTERIQENQYENISDILFSDLDVEHRLPRALKKYAEGTEVLTAAIIQRAINEGDKDAFFDTLPNGVNKEHIWEIVSK